MCAAQRVSVLARRAPLEEAPARGAAPHICLLSVALHPRAGRGGRPRAVFGTFCAAAELAAVVLSTGALLWRRRVPTHGLLNVVAAPQLGEQSTYRVSELLCGC
jgi:hypothetical protein